MKSLWKFSALAVIALGGVAQADTIPTNTATGSNLVLFVRDTSSGANPNRVYARVLNFTVDSALTQATGQGAYTGPGQTIPFSLGNIGPDANLSAFLSTGSSFSWTIMAGDTAGNGNFQQRYVTTTQLAVGPGYDAPNNSLVRGSWAQLAGMFNDLNPALPEDDGTPGFQNSTQVDGLWGAIGGPYETSTGWFGGQVGNENDIGSIANLYVYMVSALGNTGDARVFAGTQVRLNLDGSLESVGGTTPTVPLPPALYLLGSAFAGLAGVARRKKAKA